MTRLRLLRVTFLTLCTFVATVAVVAQDEPPHSMDPRLKIELFAEAPQIVTPTGIDVDHAGRIWAIESNTHFPPEGYQGHPTDRILVMEDTDQDHKSDRITVFKDGLTHTMSVAVKPVWLELASGGRESSDDSPAAAEKSRGVNAPRSPGTVVFIATRREILLCTDTDGDLKCDETKQLIRLETTGNYPHNGLAGITFDALGNMFFGFGENLGADYKIIGSDGITLSGGGEGGNVYRCQPDGSKLERWATGFWNPHASCFDAFGHMFTVDNDPDSRPPCRLLHIVPGGDYGYRFRNGRKGTHPFTSWNGEIPGTLPMISGTGESPSGIVCYESDGFPEDYIGTLLVGSWGDHRIDKFVLKPRGASFESIPQPVIKGGENFRPVGLALAPDGSMYFTDWVLKEYKLHGKGRIWRLSGIDESPRPDNDTATISATQPVPDLEALIESPRLAVRRTAARALAERPDGRKRLVLKLNSHSSLRSRVEALWALAQTPVSVEQLDLLGEKGRLLMLCDDVSEAAIRLLGTPQLSGPLPNLYDAPANPDILTLTIRSLSTDSPRARVAGEWLERHPDLKGNLAGIEVLLAFENPDPFMQLHAMRRTAGKVSAAAKSPATDEHSGTLPDQKGAALCTLLMHRQVSPRNVHVLRQAFQSSWIDVRRAAVQWAGEENLKELRPEVETVLASEPMTGDLFMACLASLSLLDGVAAAEFENAPPVQHVLPIVKDANRSALVRAIALRVLSPSLTELDAKLLGELVDSTDESLRREAVRTLAHSPISEREVLLRGIAANESLAKNLRADAVAGLAAVDHHANLNAATRDLLLTLLRDKGNPLTVEAVRSLRGPAMSNHDNATGDPKVIEVMQQLDAELKKQEPEDARTALSEAVAFAVGRRSDPKLSESEIANLKSQIANSPGDPEAGRRTFFHTNSAGCYKCHTVGGRGGHVGPDLTVIARTMDRQKLAESILEPSKEISPQFTTWAIETTSGKVLTGMLLGEEVNGDLRLGDNSGAVFHVPFNDIESRTPTTVSIMPARLHQTLTRTEFLDLIAYLEILK